jgi:hypothetical protein
MMYIIIEDHDILFVMAEGCHIAGLGVLIFKLHQKKSAAGAPFESTALRVTEARPESVITQDVDHTMSNVRCLLEGGGDRWPSVHTACMSVHMQLSRGSFHTSLLLLPQPTPYALH